MGGGYDGMMGGGRMPYNMGGIGQQGSIAPTPHTRVCGASPMCRCVCGLSRHRETRKIETGSFTRRRDGRR